MAKQQIVIYDFRAADGKTGEANVLCCAISVEEARRDICQMFGSGCIYEYDVYGDEFINERLVEVWDGGKRCDKRALSERGESLTQEKEGATS